ncbi:TetR/AcrR family transcriptional regulator [Gordonia sp. CPCC 206044]|uniref:TetR/AcrR family transcriptional regulator n=1 Tax=Gordonia sp. CPCC 206044 TaxID=3140793 RepID=UPI003AF3F436
MNGAERGPGRPRDPAAERAILDAAFELVARHGVAAVTMSAIIERAGTSSATVYRRWPTKLDLLAAAIAARQPAIADTDTGDLDSDIEVFLRTLTEKMCLRPDDLGDALVADLHRQPALSSAIADTMIAPRLDAVKAILERARNRGEIGEVSPARAYSLLIGSLQHLVQVADETPDEDFIGAAVEGAIAALRAYADPRRTAGGVLDVRTR